MRTVNEIIGLDFGHSRVLWFLSQFFSLSLSSLCCFTMAHLILFMFHASSTWLVVCRYWVTKAMMIKLKVWRVLKKHFNNENITSRIYEMKKRCWKIQYCEIGLQRLEIDREKREENWVIKRRDKGEFSLHILCIFKKRVFNRSIINI